MWIWLFLGCELRDESKGKQDVFTHDDIFKFISVLERCRECVCTMLLNPKSEASWRITCQWMHKNRVSAGTGGAIFDGLCIPKVVGSIRNQKPKLWSQVWHIRISGLSFLSFPGQLWASQHLFLYPELWIDVMWSSLYDWDMSAGISVTMDLWHLRLPVGPSRWWSYFFTLRSLLLPHSLWSHC